MAHFLFLWGFFPLLYTDKKKKTDERKQELTELGVIVQSDDRKVSTSSLPRTTLPLFSPTLREYMNEHCSFVSYG